MTRQHFEMIAAAVKATRPSTTAPIVRDDAPANAALDRLTLSLDVKFGAINPRFQTARFIAACGA